MKFETFSVFDNLFKIPLRNGLTKPKAVRGKGTRMVNMGELFANERLVNTPMERVPTTKLEFEKNKLEEGDLLFARQSLVLSGAGKCSIFLKDEEDVVFESHLIRCRLDQKLADSSFYQYYFSSRQGRSKIESIVEQVAAAGIRGSDLAKIEVIHPPLSEQKAIANILGTFDKKIELNKQTNETLEGIAKALFKSWFIDFDPVKAKSEGRSTGLPDEISDLFPDSFQDSEIGRIPSGWGFCLSSDLYKVSIGKTPPRKESWWFSKSTKDIPWISIKDMGNSSVYALETSEFLTEDAVNKFNVKVVPEETVIVSFKLTVGRVLITPTKMVTNEAIAHFISHKNLIPSSYSYCLFSNFDFRSLGSTSSIATAVNSKMLREMKILDPPYKFKQAFDQMCNPLFQKIKSNLNESSAIEEIKDAMLPKLISGELRIPDAERMIEEVRI